MKALVVGSGFEGMYTAFLLARDYGFDTQIVDPSPKFGGIMSGRDHGAFTLDYGCQVFDNFDPRITRTIQALGDGCCVGVSISYGSRFGGVVTRDTSVPDLSNRPAEAVDRMLDEVQAAAEADAGTVADTLHDYYIARWGQTAAEYLGAINLKFLGMPADMLDQNSHIYAGLKRIKIADDERSRRLKNASQAIDDRIAVARSPDDSFYPEAMAELPFPNLHPIPDSFAGYCRAARGVLERLGVSIQWQTRVHAIQKDANGQNATLINLQTKAEHEESFDLFLWSGKLAQLETLLFGSERLKSLIAPMGMHLFYHFARPEQFSDLGYFQNYDTDLDVFRWSSMGIYSRQTNADGLSFCCTEIPGHSGVTTGAEHADRHWDELRTLGLVSGDHAGDAVYVYAPNCFDRFKPGFSVAAADVMDRIDSEHQDIVYSRPNVFGRIVAAQQFYEHVEQLL